MTSEVALHALRKQALTTTLTAASEGGTPTFGAHASAEPVLLFAGSFRALQCAFHDTSRLRRDGAGMLRRCSALSIAPAPDAVRTMAIASAAHFWNKKP